MFHAIIGYCALASIAVAPPNERQSTIQPLKLDINSDGHADMVSIKNGNTGSCTLKINDSTMTFNLPGGATMLCCQNLDPKDNYMEVQVVGKRAGKDPINRFFRYDGKNIIDMGILVGRARPEYNGEVFLKHRYDEWIDAITIYGIDQQDNKLVVMSQPEWFELNKTVCIKEKLPLYTGPDCGKSLYQCETGLRYQLVLVRMPDMDAEKAVVMIKAENGLIGWTPLSTVRRVAFVPKVWQTAAK